MKFVPQAPVNTGQGEYATENCAFCTIGALTGKTSGAINATILKAAKPGQESKDTVVALGKVVLGNKASPVPYPQRHLSWDNNQWNVQQSSVDQKNGIYQQIEGVKFAVKKSRSFIDQHGSVNDFKHLVQARVWMAQMPDQTEFAVYYCSQIGQTAGHWTFAINRNTSIEFIDFQQHKAGPVPPPTSVPTCMNHKASATDAKVIVLAFGN